MKTKTLLLAVTSLCSCLLSAQDQSWDLVVKVENIKTIKGNLKLGIYEDADNFLKEAIVWGDVVIKKHTVEYTFKNLKAGHYAVSIFHDENENGKLDTNFMGIPSEPYGFSNDARGMFGPPDFSDCIIEVLDRRKEIIIRL